MFARYLPLVARRGAQITLACRPPLQPIFERVAGIDALLSPLPDQPLAKINLLQAQFDAWVPLLSLPFHLETGFATGPAEIPYLSIDPVRTPSYPTARLFRQDVQRNWSDVVETITQRLVMLAGK